MCEWKDTVSYPGRKKQYNYQLQCHSAVRVFLVRGGLGHVPYL